MISVPRGWSVRKVEGSLLLVAPAGPGAGAIRYEERLRPLARAVDLVRAAPAPAGYVTDAITPPERLVTDEGEHAAFVVMTGRIGATPVERSYGFVFGDDFYARVAGIAFDPAFFAEMRATVRALATSDTHQLGVRRRRCVYVPPRGWHGLGGLFDTTWYPRDYPAVRASITVCPAVPRVDGLCRALLDAVLAGRTLSGAQLGEAEIVHASGGLAGTSWRLRGLEGGETHVTLFEDPHYVYSLRLDTASAALAEAAARFAEVTASLEPARALRDGRGGPTSVAVSHWSE